MDHQTVRENLRPCKKKSGAKMRAPFWIKSIRDVFLDTIFPPKCLTCRRLFQSTPADPESKHALYTIPEDRFVLIHAQRLLSAYCCRDCLNAVMAVSEPLCICCGIMFNQPQADNFFCGDCLRQPYEFRMARAAIVYDAQSMAMIHRFKYDGKTQLARPFGGLLLNTFLRYWQPESIDLILPVPLHRQKFRRRGFNQSHLMVNYWEKIAMIKPMSSSIDRLRTDVLVRNKATVAQTGLGRSQRKKNIKGAFWVQRPEDVKGRTVLVVDDVFTTGATVNECARLLLKAGAENVDVLTLARAI